MSPFTPIRENVTTAPASTVNADVPVSELLTDVHANLMEVSAAAISIERCP